jgi:nuclear pore complex protein Nup107
MCEEKSQELSRLGGSFWEGGVEAVDKVVNDEANGAEEDEWKKEAISSLDNLKSIDVLEGQEDLFGFYPLQLTVTCEGHLQITLSTSRSF